MLDDQARHFAEITRVACESWQSLTQRNRCNPHIHSRDSNTVRYRSVEDDRSFGVKGQHERCGKYRPITLEGYQRNPRLEGRSVLLSLIDT